MIFTIKDICAGVGLVVIAIVLFSAIAAVALLFEDNAWPKSTKKHDDDDLDGFGI